MSMRLVLDARTVSEHFPGIGRYTTNLARAMVPLLEDNERLILLCDPAQSSPWDLTSLAGERVQLVDVSSSLFSLRQQWAIPRLLQHLGADLYHSPYFLMPYRPIVPALVTIHDLIPSHYPYHLTPVQQLIFTATVRLAARVARRVIAVSRATAHDLHHLLGLPKAKIVAIAEAADPVFRPQPPGVVAALRSRLNLSECYVLYLGSNKPHKNLVRLVEAWAHLRPYSFSLLIAGVWDSRFPQAQQRVQALALGESVHFLGPVAEKDLPALYSGAALFVFPSEYEGFGLPVLEAMACGTPVACSNASSLPEVAGDAALMFDPTQVGAIAGALASALSDADLRTELRERGLCQAALFSWKRCAQETLDLYRKSGQRVGHRG